VQSILDQTFTNFELIIINDNSTDKTVEIVKSFADKRIVLINSEGKGIADALNAGISIAKGKYI